MIIILIILIISVINDNVGGSPIFLNIIKINNTDNSKLIFINLFKK